MKFHLKKRKRILKKLLVGLGIFGLGAGISLLLTAASYWFFPLAWLAHPLTPIIVMSFIAILFYKPLDIAFTKFLNHYLFKQKNYRQMTLMKLAEDLMLVLDLREAANLIANTFGDVLHLQSAALCVPDQKHTALEIVSAYGWNASDVRRTRLALSGPLMEAVMAQGPHILVRGEVVRTTLSWQDASRLAHDFDLLRAGWVIPLFVKEDFVGLLTLRASHPEEMFDELDFHFLREFASQAARAIKNACAVSELKHTLEELQDVQSRALQNAKQTAIEQLATGIAHEIHNPLTIISGKAQVLLLQKDRHRLDDRVEEVLKTIVKQTKRASDITRKLLMFSQGSGSPKEMLRLEQVLDDTIALVSYQTSLDGIEISKTVSAPIPPYYANLHEWREVFLNLILNAVQSAAPSKGRIHCQLGYHATHQIFEIRVADNGQGIGKECLEKLFNPFFTTRPEALGLGLFVTKQIVSRCGGSIRVESRAGEGTLFIIQLPQGEAAAAPKESAEALSEPLIPQTQ